MAYIPTEAKELNTPIKILSPQYIEVSGQTKKKYPSVEEGKLLWCNWKTYGGSETVVNGVLTIIDTATVVTQYSDDIKADCRVVLLNDNSVYEILGRPENIEQRNQYCKFKVQSIGGNV